MKNSLESTQAEVAQLKAGLEHKSAADTSVAAQQIDSHEKTISNIERLFRKSVPQNNIRIDGMTEDVGENWDLTESNC